jgi:hypothetical protein
MEITPVIRSVVERIERGNMNGFNEKYLSAFKERMNQYSKVIQSNVLNISMEENEKRTIHK